LGILSIIIVDVFLDKYCQTLRLRSARFKAFYHHSTLSVVLGLIFGFWISRLEREDIEAQCRLSFEFLFMNIFLPFITLEGALQACLKVAPAQARSASCKTSAGWWGSPSPPYACVSSPRPASWAS
jgi:hypothetical protein